MDTHTHKSAMQDLFDFGSPFECRAYETRNRQGEKVVLQAKLQDSTRVGFMEFTNEQGESIPIPACAVIRIKDLKTNVITIHTPDMGPKIWFRYKHYISVFCGGESVIGLQLP